jgi:hypothetical protein
MLFILSALSHNKNIYLKGLKDQLPLTCPNGADVAAIARTSEHKKHTDGAYG